MFLSAFNVIIKVMSDDQNPQDLSQSNVTANSVENVVSVSKEGESISIKSESTNNNLESEKFDETAPKAEKQIEKNETSLGENNSVSNAISVVATTLPTSVSVSDNKNIKSLPISLPEAIKIVKSFFIFQDSSDPLLWFSFLIIKNFQFLDKNNK